MGDSRHDCACSVCAEAGNERRGRAVLSLRLPPLASSAPPPPPTPKCLLFRLFPPASTTTTTADLRAATPAVLGRPAASAVLPRSPATARAAARGQRQHRRPVKYPARATGPVGRPAPCHSETPYSHGVAQWLVEQHTTAPGYTRGRGAVAPLAMLARAIPFLHVGPPTIAFGVSLATPRSVGEPLHQRPLG